MTYSPFPKDLLPHFSAIKPENILTTMTQLLDEQRAKLQQLLSSGKHYTWENLMHPLEEMSDHLSKVWSPVSHLHGVKETDALRDAYNQVLPHLTEFYTEISQNEALFKAIQSIAESAEFKQLSAAQQKIITNHLRDFKLAGVHLAAKDKERFAELQQKLSKLMTKFSENVLDATQGWILHITNEAKIKGLPDQSRQLAIENAKRRGLEGFVFTLDGPSYSTAIRFLQDRELRKQLYNAYTTRASDQGPNASKWDNTGVMEVILQVRKEIAKLVGFSHYASYSLATKMAKTEDEVLAFLEQLLEKSLPIAEKEYQELVLIASELDGIKLLESWDAPYYSEKLQEQTFQFNQEDLRPYFPIDKVMQGMFAIVKAIFGIEVRQESGVDVWHKDVKFYSLYNEDGSLRAGFYIDLYAREHKRDGAWMDDCRTRRRLDNGEIQFPVAYLTCNFMPPVGNNPALLTHDDVLTLFHEFGHCLHHMLTKVDFLDVSGIHGVEWDAVEFPSQFMEFFCWEKATLDQIAGHYQTGAPIPEELYKKMLAAKNFQTGLQMLRQLEFSIFDFRLHMEFDAEKRNQVQTLLNEIRKRTAMINPPEFNRFQHSFSHIFAGSYGAGYYSYKWAEVLSADAYGKFMDNGILDRQTGKEFMQSILEVGGVPDPMSAFINFRGRKPTIDALLLQSGVAIESN